MVKKGPASWSLDESGDANMEHSDPVVNPPETTALGKEPTEQAAHRSTKKSHAAAALSSLQRPVKLKRGQGTKAQRKRKLHKLDKALAHAEVSHSKTFKRSSHAEHRKSSKKLWKA